LTRKLQALNLALLVLLGLVTYRIWQRREQAQTRASSVLRTPLESVQAIPEAPLRPPEPARASDYITVAENLLFARDRNPNVVLELDAPKPVPAMPFVHGVLDIGSGPTAIMSEASGKAQRGYRAGERIGEFTLVSVTSTDLVLEWEGKQIRKTVEELKPDEKAAPAPAAAAQPPAPEAVNPAKTSIVAAAPTALAAPGTVELGGGIRACQPGDTSPPGTVSGGFTKVVTESPFGKTCRWEPVK
jgi:hypothetical protein